MPVYLDTPTTPQARLDAYRLGERCGQDQIAEAISLHLYGRSHDALSAGQSAIVKGAALRALRGSQAVWREEAHRRAVLALDQAMTDEMGAPYRVQSQTRRMDLAVIGLRAVLAALIGTLELEHPFEGSGSALRIYDAAEQQTKEIR